MREHEIELFHRRLSVYDQSAIVGGMPARRSASDLQRPSIFRDNDAPLLTYAMFYVRGQHHITAYTQSTFADTSRRRFCTFRD